MNKIKSDSNKNDQVDNSTINNLIYFLSDSKKRSISVQDLVDECNDIISNNTKWATALENEWQDISIKGKDMYDGRLIARTIAHQTVAEIQRRIEIESEDNNFNILKFDEVVESMGL